MTKTQDLATIDKNAKAPATTGAVGDSLPAFLQAQVKEDAGKGVSQAADDNIIPLVYILQTNSPQCNRRGPDYIEGAKDGDLWLRNSGVPPIDGDTGMLFQPCFFSKEWVIWSPRKTGLGIIDRFDERPLEAVEKEVADDEDPTKTRKKWIMPDGNEAIETRYHAGLVIVEGPDGKPTGAVMPFVIPFKSTGHTSSRQWMFLMNSKIVGDGPAPSWACLYRVKTKSRSNPSGTWNAITIEDAGWVQTQEAYDRGSRLNAQMASGERTVEVVNDPSDKTPAEDNATGAM